MDPEAVAELQRLYAKKQRSEVSRPSKRRRINGNDGVRLQAHSGNTSDNSDAHSLHDDQRSDSNQSFTAFPSDDEHSLGLGSAQDSPVEVISFDESTVVAPRVGAVQGYKSFMSGKVPRTGEATVRKAAKTGDESEDDGDSADDLKKDRALQKLLRESHLLHGQGGDSLETEGKVRHKATAAQLISNGATKQKQRRMPIGMRKGIEAAATKREVATDKYNRDNGIITARKAAPAQKKRNTDHLHELNVGKYKNGKLTISRREIDRINGPKQKDKGKKKRGFRDFSNIGRN